MTSHDRRLGVAVVGLGVGQDHARAYAGTGRCDLRWVYDVDQPRAADVGRELGAEKVASEYQQILEDPNVDVVSIASFDDAHFGQLLAALKAGKHAFVEKPLCRTPAELAAIRDVWRKQSGRAKLASNLLLRAAPLYQWLQREVGNGRFGDLYALDGDYLYGRIEKITQGWRKDVPDYSVMQGGGIHLIDLILWLAGERPSTVTAQGNRIATQGTDFQSLDFVTATLRHRSGLVARVTANFGCVHPHQHVLRVFGTKATFLYDDAGARLRQKRDPSIPSQPVDQSARPAQRGALIPAFVDAILRDIDISAQTQSAFDGISVAMACDEAAASGRPINVEYV